MNLDAFSQCILKNRQNLERIISNLGNIQIKSETKLDVV